MNNIQFQKRYILRILIRILLICTTVHAGCRQQPPKPPEISPEKSESNNSDGAIVYNVVWMGTWPVKTEVFAGQMTIRRATKTQGRTMHTRLTKSTSIDDALAKLPNEKSRTASARRDIEEIIRYISENGEFAPHPSDTDGLYWTDIPLRNDDEIHIDLYPVAKDNVIGEWYYSDFYGLGAHGTIQLSVGTD